MSRRLRPSEITRALVAAHADLAAVLDELDPLLAALDQHTAGLSARSVDQISIARSRVGASPTERHALQHDRARADRERVAELAEWMAQATADLAAIRRRHLGDGPARPDPSKAMRCAVLARVGGNRPAASVTNVNGLLNEAMPLSLWARRFAQRHGRLPTDVEARAHLAGRRPHVAG